MRIIFTVLIILLGVSANCAALDKKTENNFVQSNQYKLISDQANVYYAENDIKNAFNILLSIPEEERSPKNWLLLGNILQDQGKSDEAVFMYNRSIDVDSKYFKAYYNLGNIYLQDGKPNLAIQNFKKVINLKPDYPYAHYNLGCAYIKLAQYKKAKYELLTAIDLKNTIPEFHYNLAYVYKQLNNQKKANIYIKYYNKLMETQQ